MFLLTIDLFSIPFYHPCTQAGWLQFIYYVRMIVILDIYKKGLSGVNQTTLHKLRFYSPWDDSPQEQGHEDVLGKAGPGQKYYSLVCRYHEEPDECGEGSNGAQVEYPPHEDRLDLGS